MKKAKIIQGGALQGFGDYRTRGARWKVLLKVLWPWSQAGQERTEPKGDWERGRRGRGHRLGALKAGEQVQEVEGWRHYNQATCERKNKGPGIKKIGQAGMSHHQWLMTVTVDSILCKCICFAYYFSYGILNAGLGFFFPHYYFTLFKNPAFDNWRDRSRPDCRGPCITILRSLSFIWKVLLRCFKSKNNMFICTLEKDHSDSSTDWGTQTSETLVVIRYKEDQTEVISGGWEEMMNRKNMRESVWFGNWLNMEKCD